MIWKLGFSNYKLQITNYDLRFTSYETELRVKSYSYEFLKSINY